VQFDLDATEKASGKRMPMSEVGSLQGLGRQSGARRISAARTKKVVARVFVIARCGGRLCLAAGMLAARRGERLYNLAALGVQKDGRWFARRA